MFICPDLMARDIVVIDPGHGGRATGATGYWGTYEKDITLKIALYVRDFLQKQGIKVIMTRHKDVDIPLKVRSEIANRVQASVFVSIHCNASLSLKPDGVETWIVGHGVNPYETDDTSSLQGPQNIVMTLWSVQNFALLVQSLLLADSIQSSIVRMIPDVTNRGIKRAGYAVLHYCRRPSVVVETGFITNKEEGKRLSTPAYQKRLARAIGKGIIHFLSIQKKKNLLMYLLQRQRLHMRLLKK